MNPGQGATARLVGWGGVAACVALVLRATLGGDFSIPPVRIPGAWCLVCGPGWLMDAVSNVVLFLPLGGSLAVAGVRAGPAAAVAALLSLTVEALQAAGIPPLRSPSLADLVTNTTGGAAGALLVQLAPLLRTPTRMVARRLLAGWLAGVLGTLALTTIALQPPVVTGDPGPWTVARSPSAHAPGYGWYGGVLEEVRVNGHPAPPRGGGPVVLVTSARPAAVHVSATLRGRDARAYQRAMVFLHTPGDTIPYALLSQQGRDLRWELRTRGYAWGLFTPSVRLRSALPEGAAGGVPPLRIDAQGGNGRLWLAARPVPDAPIRQVEAQLSPGAGWALLQSVVRLSDPMAPVVRLAWYLVLLAPLAYWSRWVGGAWGVASVVLVVAGVAGAAWAGGLPLPEAADWGSMAVAGAAGLVGGGMGGRGRPGPGGSARAGTAARAGAPM